MLSVSDFHGVAGAVESFNNQPFIKRHIGAQWERREVEYREGGPRHDPGFTVLIGAKGCLECPVPGPCCARCVARKKCLGDGVPMCGDTECERDMDVSELIAGCIATHTSEEDVLEQLARAFTEWVEENPDFIKETGWEY